MNEIQNADAAELIYNRSNTVEIGRPLRVFRADGREIPFATSVNVTTETVTRYVVDSHGQIVVEGNEGKEINEHVPGLYVEFVGERV